MLYRNSPMKKWISAEAPLIKVWGILLFVVSLIQVFYTRTPDLSEHGFGALRFLASAIFVLFLLTCTRYIRGKKIVSKKSPYREMELTVWSYVWRAYISFHVSLVIVLLAIATLILILGIVPSGTVILGPILYVLAIPLSVWLLFCPDHIAFARRVLMYLRGMPA